MSYITPQEMIDAVTGSQVKDLPGHGTTYVGLQNYIDDAQSELEEFAQRSFENNIAVAETLSSGGMGRAVIDNMGCAILYPEQAFPVNSVASIGWYIRAQETFTNVLNAVNIGNARVEKNWRGNGYRVKIFGSFIDYRNPGIDLEFSLVYNGGFLVPPAWLKRAHILWTIGLVKRRGAQAVFTDDQGQSFDLGATSGEITLAQKSIAGQIRTF